MPHTVRLRPWQRRALEALQRWDGPDYLAVATPGAGKTTFALAAAVQRLRAAPWQRVFVVTPTHHLKTQWERAAAAFALHLEPSWTPAHGRLPVDMHGVVLTYQQVAGTAEAIRSLARRAFVVFDEVHHAGLERAWGDALGHAFGDAAQRLSLSGTPFRSDTTPIPFITYAGEVAQPSFVYGYREALADGGVVRPVFFPRLNGRMDWLGPDGTAHSHTFDDRLDLARANQRLRTALSLDGEWLPTVLDQAQARLRAVRVEQADAGGLVIAMDRAHARGIAALLRARHGVEAVVATSEDPDASEKISRFAAGAEEWIVAVRMVSEGVDIPRLRVGVLATNTTTELFFRQAVGRLVRVTRRERHQKAYLFIPDDTRLRTWAMAIAEERRHSLRRRAERDEAPQPQPAGEAEQLSLFAAISAVPLGDPQLLGGDMAAGLEDDELADHAAFRDELPDDLDAPAFALVAPPVGASETGTAGGGAPAERRGTVAEWKKVMRDWNADRVRSIAQLTGLTHAQVNRELNRRAGLPRVSEATAEQLRIRLSHADRWLRRL